MFKRISEIFKQKKSEPKTTSISLPDLSEWLDNEEKTCISFRSDVINRSRETIEKAREDIIQLLSDFGIEETDEKVLHPKVEQVNRHNLPQFKRKIETALDVSFSDDDEVYYRQVAEMIDGCFKAYRGPGRYLHHLYAEEVKLFRHSMDQIGKELNHLTDAIKTSRSRLGRIEAIRNAKVRFVHAECESMEVKHLQDELDQKRSEHNLLLSQVNDERFMAAQDAEYVEYLQRINALESAQVRTNELYESLDSHIRTALTVWRKVHRALQDERKRDEEKVLDNLITLASSQNYASSKFIEGVQMTSSLIFTYLENEKVPLKNSFEKTLFNSIDGYQSQISGAALEWIDSDKACRKEKEILSSHHAAGKIRIIDERIEEINRDIRHLDDEEQKIIGRMHHIEREKREAEKIIGDEMFELTGGSITVSGIIQKDKEDI